MQTNNDQKVSVIIRTKNEEQWIGHVIQSVVDNLKKPEIIIIDNFSEDATLDIIKNFIADPLLNSDRNNKYTKIKIFQVKDYSPGKSLNYGIKKSKFNNIMVLSAHCVIKKIDIKKIKENLKKYVAIFGNQIPVWRGKKISKRYIWSHFVDKKVVNMYSKLENRFFFHNAVAFYNKKFMLKNPFDDFILFKL